MRTLSYTKNESIPAISGNPFIVYSSSMKMLLPGRIAHIKTGIKLTLPDDLLLSLLENLNKNITVLSVEIREDDEIVLTVCGYGDCDMYFVRPNEALAKIEIIKLIPESVRFIDVTGGSRKMYGNSNPINLGKDDDKDK